MRKGVKKSAYYMLINEPLSTHTTDKSASNYPHPPCQPNGMPRSGMEFGWLLYIKPLYVCVSVRPSVTSISRRW